VGWIITLVVLVILVMLALMGLQIENFQRDLTTNVGNTEETHTPGLSPLALSISSHEVLERIISFVDAHPNWEWSETPRLDSNGCLFLNRRTRWLGFRDDITVTVKSIGSGSQVHAKSKSRLGTGDLGQNPRNIRELFEGIR